MGLKRNKTKDEMYAVIGIGRFGFAVAKALAEAGKELIVVDKLESVINEATAFTDNAYLLSELSKENLKRIGIQNCDVVIVGMSGAIDVSVLVTLHVLQLGVKRVIAKATSAEHGCVLEKLGAEVVYPERDMGVRLANRLLTPQVLEYIALSDEISISEIRLPESFRETTVQTMNTRQRYRLNIIAMKHNDAVTTDIMPQTILYAGDTIAVVGKQSQIALFESDLQK